MRRPNRLPAVLLVAAMLTACTPSNPMPSPPPTTDAEPVFSSDEEALAAAEVAYSKYVETVDAILNDGGSNPERLQPLVSADLYSTQLDGFESFQSDGWHSVGSTQIDSFSLQSFSATGTITVYVCSDVSGIDVLDSSGQSQVASDRPARTAYEAILETHDEALLVVADTPWDGGGVC